MTGHRRRPTRRARTGTIAMQFAFPNPDRLVRPGQYARVRAVTELRKGALLVPQRAVSEVSRVASGSTSR